MHGFGSAEDPNNQMGGGAMVQQIISKIRVT